MATTPDELDRLRAAPPRLRLLEGGGDGPPLSVVTLMAPSAPGRDPDVVVAIGGEVDVATAARVRAELRLAQALRPGRLILDLSGVTFLDAAGIAALLSPVRAAGLHVTLVAPPGRVRRLLEMVGADRAVEVLDARPAGGAGPPPEPPPAA